MGGIVTCNDGHYNLGRFPQRVFLPNLVSLELYITMEQFQITLRKLGDGDLYLMQIYRCKDHKNGQQKRLADFEECLNSLRKKKKNRVLSNRSYE
jgi:hypothetical protein